MYKRQLASVITEDLAAVAEGIPGLGRQVSQIVLAYELLSRETWSPCTLVNPGLSTSRVYTHAGYILHHTANRFSLSDDFRPVSPSFGCCGCFNNLIVPCQVFIRRSRLFFLDVRTLSVGTCSRYGKYVQQYMSTFISCTFSSRHVQ